MRKWLRKGYALGILTVVLAVVFCFAGMAAWAGQFPDQDAKIATAKARSAAANQRAVAEKKQIAERYAKANLERQAAVQAVAVKPVADDGVVPAGKGFRRMINAAVKFVFTTPGAAAVGVYEGVKYVGSSKLENPLSRFCRGVNVGFDQFFGNTLGSAAEFVTPWQANEYADPSQLNFIAKETITWGPLAQMLRTGASVAPVACAATNVIGPLAGLTVVETTAVVGGSSVPGGFLVGKAADMAEKKLIK